MKTIIIKNLSTMRDSVVVSIVNDFMAGLNEYAKDSLQHFSLKCEIKEDDVNGRVTYTFADCGTQFDGKETDDAKDS